MAPNIELTLQQVVELIEEPTFAPLLFASLKADPEFMELFLTHIKEEQPDKYDSYKQRCKSGE